MSVLLHMDVGVADLGAGAFKRVPQGALQVRLVALAVASATRQGVIVVTRCVSLLLPEELAGHVTLPGVVEHLRVCGAGVRAVHGHHVQVGGLVGLLRHLRRGLHRCFVQLRGRSLVVRLARVDAGGARQVVGDRAARVAAVHVGHLVGGRRRGVHARLVADGVVRRPLRERVRAAGVGHVPAAALDEPPARANVAPREAVEEEHEQGEQEGGDGVHGGEHEPGVGDERVQQRGGGAGGAGRGQGAGRPQRAEEQ